MMINIKGIQKTTLIDYPGKIACIIFLGGCNFKCGYCYNSDVVFNKTSSISEEEVFSFLETRKKYIEGVCITGGEPTIHKELPNFIRQIKSLGYKVKLDTNGTNPEIVELLINNNLIDYIAMDIKCGEEKYEKITQTFVPIEKIKKSIKLIIKSGIEYEFRTTILPTFDVEEIQKIGLMIKGANKHFIQQFKTAPTMIDLSMAKLESLDKDKLEEYKAIMSDYVQNVSIRSV